MDITKNRLIVFVFLVWMALVLFFYELNWQLPLSRSTPDFDRALALLSRIRTNSTSRYGLRYRSMICTGVRNDPNILEFVLRHLIIGFSHIVIYDNNRILTGHDMDISAVLAPFVAAGLVSHVRWQQDLGQLILSSDKDTGFHECLNNYGKDADWIMILDTDEYFYYEKEHVAVDSLQHLLVELEQRPLCAISVYWTMMYGEGRMLRPRGTLLDQCPRICQTLWQTKVLFRLNDTDVNVPHNAKCKNGSNRTTTAWSSNAHSKIALVHYYGKSVEEFLVKGDQSMPPYIKEPRMAYREAGGVCSRVRFNYSKDYSNTFRELHKQLSSFQVLHLLPPPLLNIEQMDASQYALFMYMKYRCAKREEFDHQTFLSGNPDVQMLIANGTYTDSLHYFMENFFKGVRGCWKTSSYSICD